MKSSTLRALALAITAVFLVAACGPAAASPTPTPAPTPVETMGPAPTEGEQGPTERPTGPPAGQASEFTVPTSGIGISTVALLAAIDDLRAEGYTIHTPDLAGYELATEGVAQGTMHFSAGVTAANLRAIELGAPLRIIGSRIGNEWLLYAREGLETCEEILSARVAIHSAGSTGAALIRDWKNKNCPDAPYEPLVIPGSENRVAAMLANQVDASPVDFADARILDQEGGFKRVVVFRDALPDIRTSTIAGNKDWMAANPDVTKAFLRAIILQHRRINSEPGYLVDLIKRYLPEEAEDEEELNEIANEYIELGLFDNNGGITEADLPGTIAYYGPNGTGNVESELDPADVAELSYLNEVLEELGRI